MKKEQYIFFKYTYKNSMDNNWNVDPVVIVSTRNAIYMYR